MRFKQNGWFSTVSTNVDEETGIDRFLNKFGMTEGDGESRRDDINEILKHQVGA